MASTKRQRIRVCLKAYDHKLIDVSSDKIVETAKRTDAKVAGPIPLPTKRRIYCVLRSPHVDKKSREHFELRTHKRIIDIYEPTQQTTEELSRLDLPAGVDIEVNSKTVLPEPVRMSETGRATLRSRSCDKGASRRNRQILQKHSF